MNTSLENRTIVIGGGTGDVGVEITAKLLASGATVIALIRSIARAKAFGDHPRLHLIEDFPEDEAAVHRVRSSLAGFGLIHGAVASLGPWFHGPALTELPLEDWEHMVTSSLTSHYLFARAVVPSLKNSGQYVMINGAGALQPIPHSGVVSVLAHAQIMLGQVLAAENPATKVHTLMLRSIIATRARPQHDPTWISASEVGEMVAWLVSPQGRLTGSSTTEMHPKDAQSPTFH